MLGLHSVLDATLLRGDAGERPRDCVINFASVIIVFFFVYVVIVTIIVVVVVVIVMVMVIVDGYVIVGGVIIFNIVIFAVVILVVVWPFAICSHKERSRRAGLDQSWVMNHCHYPTVVLCSLKAAGGRILKYIGYAGWGVSRPLRRALVTSFLVLSVLFSFCGR